MGIVNKLQKILGRPVVSVFALLLAAGAFAKGDGDSLEILPGKGIIESVSNGYMPQNEEKFPAYTVGKPEVKISEIKNANPHLPKDLNKIPLETRIKIPSDAVTYLNSGYYYRVQLGDDLGKIAEKLGFKGWRELYERNKNIISNPDLIFPGQPLYLGDVSMTHFEDLEGVFLYERGGGESEKETSGDGQKVAGGLEQAVVGDPFENNKLTGISVNQIENNLSGLEGVVRDYKIAYERFYGTKNDPLVVYSSDVESALSSLKSALGDNNTIFSFFVESNLLNITTGKTIGNSGGEILSKQKYSFYSASLEVLRNFLDFVKNNPQWSNDEGLLRRLNFWGYRLRSEAPIYLRGDFNPNFYDSDGRRTLPPENPNSANPTLRDILGTSDVTSDKDYWRDILEPVNSKYLGHLFDSKYLGSMCKIVTLDGDSYYNFSSNLGSNSSLAA